MLTAVAAMVVVIGGVVGALFGTGVVSLASTGIPLGSGTATITWPASTSSTSGQVPPPSAFHGTVASRKVQGNAQVSPSFLVDIGALAAKKPINLPAEVPFYTISGTMDSTYFAITISVPRSELERSFNGSSNATLTRLDVTGHYGKEKVTGELTPVGNPNAPTALTHLDVTIGSLHAVGTITDRSGTDRATATFSVS